MIKISASFVINQPVEVVFDFVAVHFFENLGEWNPALVEIKKLSKGPVGKGTCGHEVQTIQGKPYRRTFEIVQFEVNKLFSVSSLEPAEKEVYHTSYTFRPQGSDQTLFNYDFNLMMNNPFFKYLKPIAKRVIAKDLKANLQQRLKLRLEQLQSV